MSEEKRRHERFAMTQKIELTDAHNNKYFAQGVNISESGLRCTTDRPIEPGTPVTVPLSIIAENSSRIITCDGTILRCTEEKGKFTVIIDFTDGEKEDNADA